MANLFGILLPPVLLGGGLLGFTLWRSGRRSRTAGEVAPGRVVIASNLVSSRQQHRW